MAKGEGSRKKNNEVLLTSQPKVILSYKTFLKTILSKDPFYR